LHQYSKPEEGFTNNPYWQCKNFEEGQVIRYGFNTWQIDLLFGRIDLTLVGELTLDGKDVIPSSLKVVRFFREEQLPAETRSYFDSHCNPINLHQKQKFFTEQRDRVEKLIGEQIKKEKI